MEILSVSWKRGAVTNGIPAESAHDELVRIREENDGKLTDEAIVRESKGDDSLLHGFFEWNDALAADSYRLSQARCLIRSITVTYKEAPKEKVRAFQVEKREFPASSKRTVYTTTEEIMSAPELRDQLIARAIREAMDFRRKFKHLHELAKVMEEIEKLTETIVNS